MKGKAKKLRWYVVWDGDDLGYVVCSTSHSKAKIEALCGHLGYYDHWEALLCSCQLVKQDLPIKPTEEMKGKLYPSNQDLIDCGLFTYIEC